MADTNLLASEGSGDTLSNYRAGVTWLVGLSGAAVGGAFLNFDKVSAAPVWIRFLFAAAAVCFGVGVYSGVRYLFYLNSASNQSERAKFIEKALGEATAEPEKEKRRAQAEQTNAKIDKAWERINSTHPWLMRSFGSGILLSLALLAIVVISGITSKTGEAGTQNFISAPLLQRHLRLRSLNPRSTLPAMAGKPIRSFSIRTRARFGG